MKIAEGVCCILDVIDGASGRGRRGRRLIIGDLNKEIRLNIRLGCEGEIILYDRSNI